MIYEHDPSLDVYVKSALEKKVIGLVVLDVRGVKNVMINPLIFIGAGIFAMALSTSHLGNKIKAYRAILNFKTSWLSREIVFVSSFLGLSIFYILIPTASSILGWITIFAGFLALFSIDMLYGVALTKIPLHFHSASTFLTAIFLFGVFTLSPTIIVIFAVIKLTLYVYRKFIFFRNSYSTLPLASFFRIILGFIVPLIIFLSTNDSSGDLFITIILSVVLGEIIDRCEFYAELDIITPGKQINMDLNNSEPTFGKQ